ncbi:MAG TPA: RidA family protein [Desulfovibrio sp.]|uniref:RidA family protein n=1 Tax=Desulfovibrio sp. TaxID=885 RepID=UPI002D2AEE17|nr:RidA family protein [Desulfovibrio sp.]HZF62596.1 RidA family protein [Desulfovibrio sp.]
MSQRIATEKAPAAIGPYSQGMVGGALLFTSGQIPVDPSTKAVSDDVADQARQSLENVKAVVEAGGSSMNRVVKTTVFLADMGDFAAVNQVYSTFFAEPFPARSCVQVAALPLGVKVEIEAIAVL